MTAIRGGFINRSDKWMFDSGLRSNISQEGLATSGLGLFEFINKNGASDGNLFGRPCSSFLSFFQAMQNDVIADLFIFAENFHAGATRLVKGLKEECRDQSSEEGSLGQETLERNLRDSYL